MTDSTIWAPLAEGRTPLLFNPGQLIYLQDTQATQFYYILEGTVKCFLSAGSGEERILTVHHADDLIGEAAFFDKQPRVSSAVAMTACTLIPVDREHLYAVFSKYPDLAISMLEYLSRTVRLLSTHVDGSFLQADQRIARYLISCTVRANGSIPCTHEEIGASVGVSRVTVSRVLSEFARLGWIKTGYRTIRIQKRSALERLVAASCESCRD